MELQFLKQQNCLRLTQLWILITKSIIHIFQSIQLLKLRRESYKKNVCRNEKDRNNKRMRVQMKKFCMIKKKTRLLLKKKEINLAKRDLEMNHQTQMAPKNQSEIWKTNSDLFENEKEKNLKLLLQPSHFEKINWYQ